MREISGESKNIHTAAGWRGGTLSDHRQKTA
uniref:Uncharacterized protein n=1 Tax=Anguilla anguilla TaxID=7936 RepID=A0A0E9W5S7_ANGAN